MKFNLLLFFLTVSSFVFSQNTLKQKDSIAKNLTSIEGKAIVYILRPTSYGALVKMKVKCDGVDIGTLLADKYLYTIVDTGLHNFASKAENIFSMYVTLENGKVYYIKQQVKMGFLFAESGLKMIDEKEGKKYLSKCRLSKDNVYSN